MTMILRCVAQPEKEPLALADVEAQCRIGSLSDESTAVELFIAAVRQQGEAITRRAFITQQWEMTLDGFPAAGGAITLPLPPLQSVGSITYIDTDGVTQTLDPSLYRVVSSAEPAYILPVYGTTWPSTRNEPATVAITFTAGYGADPGDVPAGIRQWMLLNVATLYENRETEGIMTKGAVFNFKSLADSLLASYRVYGW